jgi:hypothetical protein
MHPEESLEDKSRPRLLQTVGPSVPKLKMSFRNARAATLRRGDTLTTTGMPGSTCTVDCFSTASMIEGTTNSPRPLHRPRLSVSLIVVAPDDIWRLLARSAGPKRPSTLATA